MLRQSKTTNEIALSLEGEFRGILPSSFLDFCSFSRVMFDGGR
jgi:hypothetical protein